jgi:sugar phosphate isomerase/epimerase
MGKPQYLLSQRTLIMKPCLSEATTMTSSFADDVAAYADAGCQAMEVWLTKLEQHLSGHSGLDTSQLLQDHNMTLAAASYQGGLMTTTGEQQRVQFDQFQRRLDLCQRFGIPTMVIVADFLDRIDSAKLDVAMASLARAADLASRNEVKLALEFQSTAQWCRGLDTALALAAATEAPNLGVNLDLFHYYTGPSKSEDLKALNSKNLFHVQVCDLAALTRDMATDSDRILPGDGDIPLVSIFETLRGADYTGYVSVELFNPVLWKMKPKQVAANCLAALRRVIEPAKK